MNLIYCDKIKICESYPLKCKTCKHNKNRKEDFYEPIDESEKESKPYIDPSGKNPNITDTKPYIFNGEPLSQQFGE